MIARCVHRRYAQRRVRVAEVAQCFMHDGELVRRAGRRHRVHPHRGDRGHGLGFLQNHTHTVGDNHAAATDPDRTEGEQINVKGRVGCYDSRDTV